MTNNPTTNTTVALYIAEARARNAAQLETTRIILTHLAAHGPSSRKQLFDACPHDHHDRFNMGIKSLSESRYINTNNRGNYHIVRHDKRPLHQVATDYLAQIQAQNDQLLSVIENFLSYLGTGAKTVPQIADHIAAHLTNQGLKPTPQNTYLIGALWRIIKMYDYARITNGKWSLTDPATRQASAPPTDPFTHTTKPQ